VVRKVLYFLGAGLVTVLAWIGDLVHFGPK